MGFRTTRPAAADGTPGVAVNDAVHHGHSGVLATLLSAVALLFSGLSYYESALKAADLEIYVPPVMQYARDNEGDVFALPITISNNGSNTGTVLAMELVAENRAAEGEGSVRSKVFYSAFTGEHPREAAAISKSFAPISVPGRASYTETVRFYPQGYALPRVVTDKGEYHFTLKVQIAAPASQGWLERQFAPKAPAAITFTRRLPYFAGQHLEFRRGTISMHAPDWQPAIAGSAPK
jgi:hypothetical protein